MLKVLVLLTALVAVACATAVPTSEAGALVRSKRMAPLKCLAAEMWDSEENVERIMDDCYERFGNGFLSKSCFVAHYMHLTPKQLKEFVGCVFASDHITD